MTCQTNGYLSLTIKNALVCCITVSQSGLFSNIRVSFVWRSQAKILNEGYVTLYPACASKHSV